MNLQAIWLWFAAAMLAGPCLTIPTMRLVNDIPTGGWGSYNAARELVTVERGHGDWVAIHEFAHHYWHVCNVDERPVGRFFLRVTGHESWTRQAREEWAATLTFVLTGQPRWMWDVRLDAAHTMRRIILFDG
jgi:hypothetical protein